MLGEERYIVTNDADALAREGAQSFAQCARIAAAHRKRFAVALTGGASPRGLYRLLAQEPYRSQIPWQAIHLFWGDERCVPPDHPRSNYRMAHEAFISQVPIPPQNVHRMRGEIPVDQAAEEYEAVLHDFFGRTNAPRFDLIHLGLGANGHIASLFPHAAVLRQRAHPVYPAYSEDDDEQRLTLALQVINAAARVELLVPEGELADMVQAVIAGPRDPLAIPAQLVHPEQGETIWYLTKDSAARLDPSVLATPTPRGG